MPPAAASNRARSTVVQIDGSKAIDNKGDRSAALAIHNERHPLVFAIYVQDDDIDQIITWRKYHRLLG